MITSLVLEGVVGLLEWLLGLLPDWDAPGFMTDLPGYAATAGEQAAEFGHWLPLGLLIDLSQALMVLYLAMLGVRLGRRVISLFTGGGGG